MPLASGGWQIKRDYLAVYHSPFMELIRNQLSHFANRQLQQPQILTNKKPCTQYAQMYSMANQHKGTNAPSMRSLLADKTRKQTALNRG